MSAKYIGSAPVYVKLGIVRRLRWRCDSLPQPEVFQRLEGAQTDSSATVANASGAWTQSSGTGSGRGTRGTHRYPRRRELWR